LGGAYLNEELEVDIVGLGRDALGLLVPAAGDEVDALRGEGVCASVEVRVPVDERPE
jgi:hypothetical protein